MVVLTYWIALGVLITNLFSSTNKPAVVWEKKPKVWPHSMLLLTCDLWVNTPRLVFSSEKRLRNMGQKFGLTAQRVPQLEPWDPRVLPCVSLCMSEKVLHPYWALKLMKFIILHESLNLGFFVSKWEYWWLLPMQKIQFKWDNLQKPHCTIQMWVITNTPEA